MNSKKLLILFAVLTPSFVFAKNDINDFTKAVFEGLVSPVLSLTATSLLVYYVFIIAKYMWDKDQNETDRIALRKHLIWGGFGLFIVFSIGGIYALISNFVPSF